MVDESARLTNVKAMGNMYGKKASGPMTKGLIAAKRAVRTNATSAHTKAKRMCDIFDLVRIPLEMAVWFIVKAMVRKCCWRWERELKGSIDWRSSAVVGNVGAVSCFNTIKGVSPDPEGFTAPDAGHGCRLLLDCKSLPIGQAPG